MRPPRPIRLAAFLSNRLSLTFVLIGVFVVLASTASQASAATFVKSWHAPSPQGIAIGSGSVYVAAADGLKSFTKGGDLQWADPSRSGACSAGFRRSDGHVFVGTCTSRGDGFGGDGVYEYDAEGRFVGRLIGFSNYHGWSNIQAVAAHADHVYFSEDHKYAVIDTIWPFGPWDETGFNPAPGLALTANRLYAVQNPRVRTRGAGGLSWGARGSGNGQFNDPQGIAVGGPLGNVYVADTGNNRIQEFTHNGAFLNAWTGPGPDGGNFSAPMEVDVDRTGHVYVADTGHDRIVKFVP